MCLKLVRPYLSNRKQYVQGKNAKSSMKIDIAGVPQGLILGPSFFSLLLLNDFPNSNVMKTIRFVNDTVCV